MKQINIIQKIRLYPRFLAHALLMYEIYLSSYLFLFLLDLLGIVQSCWKKSNFANLCIYTKLKKKHNKMLTKCREAFATIKCEHHYNSIHYISMIEQNNKYHRAYIKWLNTQQCTVPYASIWFETALHTTVWTTHEIAQVPFVLLVTRRGGSNWETMQGWSIQSHTRRLYLVQIYGEDIISPANIISRLLECDLMMLILCICTAYT